MRAVIDIPADTLAKMRTDGFSVSPDGTLVYDDPIIGPLAHHGEEIRVRINPQRLCLELTVRGVEMNTFGLLAQPMQACREAFSAYFRALSEAFGRPRLHRAVA